MGQRDMLLELSVLSYHRLSPRQVAVKRFDAAGGSLGRSEQADWYLPDPERVVSGVHALISYINDAFTITDKSTNGLFVNRAVEALGAGNQHVLKHGDVLSMGDYEIQVALIDAMPPEHTTSNEHQRPVTSFEATPANSSEGVTEHAAGLSIADVAADIFSGADNVVSTSRNKHSEPQLTLDDHFLAPSALIPDDWASEWQATDKTPVREASTSSVASKAVGEKITGSEPAQQCLQAFLKGLGVQESDPRLTASAQWWETLGQALQQSLQGVIGVMRERSNVKNTFRVNQTTFQQRENNPLKFSANTEEAFHNLFNRKGASFMPARQAIAEAFADISRHEAAILAGTAGAMTGLLTQLSPARIEASDFGGSFVDKVNPAQRQARLWSRYKALHSELVAEANNKDKQGVNDDFISAYEASLQKKQNK